MWPDRGILDLVGIETPIIQAPMAGANGSEMVVAVSEAGGLGSLPCAMLDPENARREIGLVQRSSLPLNVNFFCHKLPRPDQEQDANWKKSLAAYYLELGVEAPDFSPKVTRKPFDDAMCEIVEDCRPKVVSFHFGLPRPDLLERVKNSGCLVFSSATTVEEARWLEDRGCDAIIAQGSESGGHRGMFLTKNTAAQIGTIALVPQVADAVDVPVIAAGGIADGRGIAAAFALGASAAQIGTAYLLTPEAKISSLHRSALASSDIKETALTNLFSGRPARGLMNRLMREAGPMSNHAPVFPTAATALAPLKAKAEAEGKNDFSSMWAGQGAGYCRPIGAGDLTRELAREALEQFKSLAAT
jgi:nitronate monooxygenase